MWRHPIRSSSTKEVLETGLTLAEETIGEASHLSLLGISGSLVSFDRTNIVRKKCNRKPEVEKQDGLHH